MTKKTRRDNRFNPRRTSKKIHSFERELVRLGKRQFAFMKGYYKEKLIPQIKDPFSHLDADETEIDRLRRLLDEVTKEGLTQFERKELDRKIRDVMRRVDLESLVQVEKAVGDQKQVLAVYNRAIDGVIKRSVKDTVSGFKDLGDATKKRLDKRIVSGMVSGERHESIARGIRGMLDDGDEEGSAIKRAKFIARNAVSTALGEINKERQEALGIELYQWQTAEDDRVRETHVELNGGIFSWSDKVKVNGKTYKPAIDPQYSESPTIPGQPWNCRCVALAYIPELEED